MPNLPYKKSPIGDGKWDAGEQVKAADVETLKMMCCGYRGDGETKGDYYLPHHNTDGTVPRAALHAAAGRIDQTEGNDAAADRAHLGKHYADADEVPPWEKAKASTLVVPANFQSRVNLRGDGIPIQAQVDASTREITAYAATMNVVDYNDRRLLGGVFDKSIRERLPTKEIKLFAEHCTNIGYVTYAEEDSDGLLTVSRVTATKQGDDVLEMCADGTFSHYSYYAKAIVYTFVPEDPNESPDLWDQIMEVKEAVLCHVGPVSEPANRAARILMVRAAQENLLTECGDLVDVVRHILNPRTQITRRDRFAARQFLKAARDLIELEPQLRALIEPAHGTPSPRTAPPLATESSAVAEASPSPEILAQIQKLLQARNAGYV